MMSVRVWESLMANSMKIKTLGLIRMWNQGINVDFRLSTMINRLLIPHISLQTGPTLEVIDLSRFYRRRAFQIRIFR